MSEAKHTPGPWRVEDGELLAGGDSGAVVLGSIHGADDYPCCEEDIDAECKANARLIAAAPDLLALLEEAYDALPHGDLAGRIAAALAKAKGA